MHVCTYIYIYVYIYVYTRIRHSSFIIQHSPFGIQYWSFISRYSCMCVCMQRNTQVFLRVKPGLAGMQKVRVLYGLVIHRSAFMYVGVCMQRNIQVFLCHTWVNKGSSRS